MTTLREAAQQALEALVHGARVWDAMNILETALKKEPKWKLSCGCPSQYGGIPAEWPAATREGDPATAYGVICEGHWHEYEARCPNCASLEEQNTELDRKLAELERREWRELTSDELSAIHEKFEWHDAYTWDYERAIQEALKEKNHEAR